MEGKVETLNRQVSELTSSQVVVGDTNGISQEIKQLETEVGGYEKKIRELEIELQGK